MAKRRARGEGSLRKRSDGRWEGRYTVGRDPETGKLIYRNVLARTQAECKSKLREAIKNVQQEPEETITEPTEDQKQSTVQYTTEQWLRTWFELYSKPNLREATQDQYTNFLDKHLIPNIGDIPLEELTSLRLQKLYQDLRTSGRVNQNRKASPGLSPKTVRSIHMMLHTALEQAVKEGVISKNPTDGCIPPKLQKKEMNVIQPEQVGAYLQAAADRNVLPMFYLELTSGLRRGELLALLWDDLDIEKCTISVNKSVAGRHGELKVSAPKTQHSIRKVVIPQQAVDLLVQEHNQHPENPYMFPSPVTGTMYHPDTAGRLHKKLLKESGIENVRFHDLRHTFSTAALEHGMDVKTLSTIIGHVSSSTTLNVYAHVTDEMRRTAAVKIDQGIGRVEPRTEIETVPPKPAPSTFQAHKGQRRKAGTGCVTQINEKLWEGRYSPIWPDGKKHARNVYAHSEEECEELLTDMIAEMKMEIAAEKERIKNNANNVLPTGRM